MTASSRWLAAPRADFPLLAAQPGAASTSTPRPRRRSRSAVLDAITRLLHHAERQPAPRRLRALGRGDQAYHDARAHDRPLPRGRPTRHAHLHARHHREPEPRGHGVGACATCRRATTSWSRALEHHANFVPWQQLARSDGRRVPDRGARRRGRAWTSRMLALLVDARTKVVAFGARLQRAGHDQPVAEIVRIVRAAGAGARRAATARRRAPHLRVHFDALGVDVYAFSGHKMLRPDGDRRRGGAARARSRRCRPTSSAAT